MAQLGGAPPAAGWQLPPALAAPSDQEVLDSGTLFVDMLRNRVHAQAPQLQQMQQQMVLTTQQAQAAVQGAQVAAQQAQASEQQAQAASQQAQAAAQQAQAVLAALQQQLAAHQQQQQQQLAAHQQQQQQQLAAMQQQLAAMQQQLAAMQQAQAAQLAAQQQQLGILLNRTSPEQRLALQSNGRSLLPAHPLVAMPHPDTGALPPAFPATNDALDGMPHAQLGALLAFYGQPVNGNRQVRRNRLKAFIGQ
ncbi:hypothetical protein ABPG75_010604 [Micractinium tetrahymenae]